MRIPSASRAQTIVGLDIEAGSVAATEVTTNGGVKLGRTAIAGLAPGVTREGEVTDPDALGAALKEMFAENKLSRAVRVGLASQKVMVRTNGGNTITLDDTPGVGGITLETATGQKISLTPLGIEIDNGMGAKISLTGPQVSVNNGALDVI